MDEQVKVESPDPALASASVQPSISPLPWTVKFSNDVIAADDRHIMAMGRSSKEQQANAEYLVRCANAFPALVDALREVTEWLAGQRDFELGNAYPEEYAAVEKAREALKLAEGP